MKNYKLETKKDLVIDEIFKMSDVTKKLKVTPRTIRYYDSEGLLGEVKRSIGFTRYFTQNEIDRLKEILKLKKKGFRIAEIKEMFEKKYPQESIDTTYDHISIQDVLLNSADIESCLKHQIKIVESTISFGSVNLNYTDWHKLNISEFLKPFTIIPDEKPKEDICLMPQETKGWLGNGQRAIVHYMVQNIKKKPVSKAVLKEYESNLTEWLIIPIKFNTSYRLKDQLPNGFVVETRTGGNIEKNIVFEDELAGLLEKQFKAATVDVSRLMKQVVLSMNESSQNKIMKAFIQKSVPNKDILLVEPLTPINIQSIGSTHAVLISMF